MRFPHVHLLPGTRTLIVAVVLFDFNMVASGIKVVKQYELPACSWLSQTTSNSVPSVLKCVCDLDVSVFLCQAFDYISNLHTVGKQ